MNNVHPMFVSIFRAYGVAPTEDEEESVCEFCRVRTDQLERAPCKSDDSASKCPEITRYWRA